MTGVALSPDRLPRPLLPSFKKDAWGPLLSLPFFLFLVIPILALFLRITPDEFIHNLTQMQIFYAIRVSMLTTLTTVLITLLFGTPVAYVLAQRRSKFTRIWDTLVDLPTVLPPAVTGVALLMAFGRYGLIGKWFNAAGISISFTQVAVILAQTFIAAPLYIKTAAVGFAGVSQELKRAAALDGANEAQTFFYVTVPLSWMALLSGSVLTWARALGEFGATIIFAGNFPNRTQTMPLAIYTGFEIDLNIPITLSIFLVGFSFITLVVVKFILGQTLETSTIENE